MAVRLLVVTLLVAAACGGARAADPSAPPRTDSAPTSALPGGPLSYEPEQLIFPPEEFPLKADIARDAPIAVHGWERQFATNASADFRWFTLRLFVMEPDVPATRFVADHGCGSVSWQDEKPASFEVAAGDLTAKACRYEFEDGSRVLYYTSGFRNVGLLIGTQPRRDQVTDKIAVDWLAALSRQQVQIIARVLLSASN